MLLPLARLIFVLVGVVALLAGIGQLIGAFSPGTRLDLVPILWGIGLGLGALAAAVWVRSTGGLTAAAAWAGIAAMLATSLWPLYYLLTHLDAGPDVILLAILPSLIGLTASFGMAQGRWAASRGS